MTQWLPDVLGDEFSSYTLDLGEDSEGPLEATLVRALPRHKAAWWQRLTQPQGLASELLHDVDVLYVHGWSDYFFQKRVARSFTDRGARFFALDLRKYGRSLRPGQTPGFITNLDDYDQEISAALAVIAQDAGGPRRLVLMGHSTGGLVLSLWANRNPGVAHALVLNSPWLEFQLSGITREALAPIMHLTASRHPMGSAPQVDLGFYSRAQNVVADPADPMQVVSEWRPDQSWTVHHGWLNAIMNGHGKVYRGLNIETPVLVMLSARSAVPTVWSEELTRSDTVLTVENIARAALKLGPTVTVSRIDGALHDIFLSAAPVREDAYRQLDRWIVGWNTAYPSRTGKHQISGS